MYSKSQIAGSAGHFGHFRPDFHIKFHLIPAQTKQTFEIKTVGVSRYNEIIPLNLHIAIVKFTFDEFSFFSFFCHMFKIWLSPFYPRKC